MPTVNQLIRKPRRRKKNKSISPALMGNPQQRGTVTRLALVKPKKPNSAERRTVRVRLNNGKYVTAYVPGDASGTILKEHSSVLIKGRGPPDLPGIKYRVIMGTLDTTGGSPGRMDPKRGGGTGERIRRTQGRSLYGVKRMVK